MQLILIFFLGGVPPAKNEGVVKRHVFAAMLSSPAWISDYNIQEITNRSYLTLPAQNELVVWPAKPGARPS